MVEGVCDDKKTVFNRRKCCQEGFKMVYPVSNFLRPRRTKNIEKGGYLVEKRLCPRTPKTYTTDNNFTSFLFCFCLAPCNTMFFHSLLLTILTIISCSPVARNLGLPGQCPKEFGQKGAATCVSMHISTDQSQIRLGGLGEHCKLPQSPDSAGGAYDDFGDI